MRIIGGWMDIIDYDNLDRYIKDINYNDNNIEFIKFNYDEIKKINNNKLFLHESNL